MPSLKLTLFQKGAHYSGSKILNHLLSSIKELSNDVKSFKGALKIFLQLIHFVLWMNFLRDKAKNFGLSIHLYNNILFKHIIYDLLCEVYYYTQFIYQF
jgi:hypothetical protein